MSGTFDLCEAMGKQHDTTALNPFLNGTKTITWNKTYPHLSGGSFSYSSENKRTFLSSWWFSVKFHSAHYQCWLHDIFVLIIRYEIPSVILENTTITFRYIHFLRNKRTCHFKLTCVRQHYQPYCGNKGLFIPEIYWAWTIAWTWTFHSMQWWKMGTLPIIELFSPHVRMHTLHTVQPIIYQIVHAIVYAQQIASVNGP